MNVLVIEDDNRISSLVDRALTEDGHYVTVSDNGREGADKLLSGRFDAALLDILLPEMDGFEVLEQVRNKRCKTPILVLTAVDAVPKILHAFECARAGCKHPDFLHGASKGACKVKGCQCVGLLTTSEAIAAITETGKLALADLMNKSIYPLSLYDTDPIIRSKPANKHMQVLNTPSGGSDWVKRTFIDQPPNLGVKPIQKLATYSLCNDHIEEVEDGEYYDRKEVDSLFERIKQLLTALKAHPNFDGCMDSTGGGGRYLPDEVVKMMGEL